MRPVLEAEVRKRLRHFELDVRFAAGPGCQVLIGPSGAGKSTLLHLLAGLLRPDRGWCRLDGRLLFDTSRRLDRPPAARRIGFVPQDYALFPHLDVAANVAFGLRARRLPRAEIDRRVGEWLERLGLDGLARSRPGSLSGGERQRVALARALVVEPRLLLLDEPLAALDPATRGEVRRDLARLFRAVPIPVLLVSHDYEDAWALGDRLLVLERGRIVQAGRPGELFARPRSAYVARFGGLNWYEGWAEPDEGSGLTRVRLDEGPVLWSAAVARGRVGVAIAPWAIRIGDVATAAPAEPTAPAGVARLTGRVREAIPSGSRYRLRIEAAVPITVETGGGEWEAVGGDPVTLALPPAAVRLVPLTSPDPVGGEPSQGGEGSVTAG